MHSHDCSLCRKMLPSALGRVSAASRTGMITESCGVKGTSERLDRRALEASSSLDRPASGFGDHFSLVERHSEGVRPFLENPLRNARNAADFDDLAEMAKLSKMAESEPPLHELESMSATEAKNSFGSVLDRVMAGGKIAITKHEEVRAVVLSAREYEALLSNQHDPLRALHGEFEELVARMQTGAAKRAGRALFEATPARLGRAAVANLRRRG